MDPDKTADRAQQGNCVTVEQTYLEKLQEILIKAPTPVAARSALTVLVGLAQDADFDAFRSLSQALASELGYDPHSDGFVQADSIEEFVNAADIPPLLRIYALRFWPRLVDSRALSKELADALEKDNAFERFQLLVKRDAPVQHELLKAYVLGVLVQSLRWWDVLSAGLVSRRTWRGIVEHIRTNCRVVLGMNADSDFNFGRDRIIYATGWSSFAGVVAHEITHPIVFARSQFNNSPDDDDCSCFPTVESCVEVVKKLPALLKFAVQLKGKPFAPEDAPPDRRMYTTSRGISLHCSYVEAAGGTYTHFFMSNSAGPIELRANAAWGYLVLLIIGVDVAQTAAVFSPHGVFHFGFLGSGPDAAAFRDRLQRLDIPQLLHGLEAGSAQWLNDLAKGSRIGQVETDIPIMLGVQPREPRFYGYSTEIAWVDLQVCQHLQKELKAISDAPDGIRDDILCQAVRCGDPAVVRNLLATGSSAQARARALFGLPGVFGCVSAVGYSLCVIHDQSGKSYYGPSAANLLETIAVLTSAGLDLNERLDTAGNTLLHGAAGRNVELIQFFLSQGAKASIANAQGRTPLFDAVSTGPLSAVQALLDAGADPRTKDNSGITPLRCAVERGDAQIIALLLQSGAQVDAASSDGQTPLMQAAWSGQENVVKLLLDNGADVDAGNTQGQTAMHFAVWSPITEAQLAILDALLAAGADVDEEADDGATPLMLAASGANLDTAKFLLTRQANINATDRHGNTPLILALKSNNVRADKDFIQEFLNRGADPLHNNAAGENPKTLTQGERHREVNSIITEAAKNRTRS